MLMSRLVIIRGNSGSGKSTIAAKLHGMVDGSVLIEQDYYIKYMSADKEQDALRKQRIFDDVKRALDQGNTVILEGVFDSRRYKDYFDDLISYHPGNTILTYLDVPFGETLRRHQQRAKKDQFGETEMRGWYIAHDSLGYEGEVMLDETCSLEDALASIVMRSGLGEQTSLLSLGR